jgi:ornithine carbamoyltransferase
MPIMKDFLTLWDLSVEELEALLDAAMACKGAAPTNHLGGSTIALIFEKPSTRTKVSFTAAVHELRGHVVTLEHGSCQLGRGETYADTARVLSTYVKAIVLRTFAQSNLEEMAEYATVPVINALSDQYHPCQVLADLLTVKEEFGSFTDLKIAWLGDGNNMAQSWMVAAAKLGFALHLASPESRTPDEKILSRAQALNSNIVWTDDPHEAIDGAHVVNVDTWKSMGDKGGDDMWEVFGKYQLNQNLLSEAAKDAIALHCLPAHRGEEITDEVIDGTQSRVWKQAGNRLPVQRAVLKTLTT